MSKIALIAGSYKPMHVGHWQVIKLASETADEVRLFVSLADRVKKGEAPIFGRDMETLWHATLERSLPKNVRVSYSPTSPIGDIWKALGQADQEASNDDFILFSDPDDMTKNFPLDRLKKYCGGLVARGLIHLRPIPRSQTVDISGTQMRAFLLSGDIHQFVKFLPPNIDHRLVWNVLYDAVVEERARTIISGR